MSFSFSPSHIPNEKFRVLPDRLDTNIIPFPSIQTPQSPLKAPPRASSISFPEFPNSLLPHPITDSTSSRSQWRKQLAWSSLQGILSGSAAFWGWDMIAGCAFYNPNPLYAVDRICSSSNRSAVILSTIVAFGWGISFVHNSSHRHLPHPQRVFCTLLFLGPISSLLLGILGALVMLGDLGPQGVVMLHVLSALCACMSIFLAVVGNVFD
jgi:hypothetical protein